MKIFLLSLISIQTALPLFAQKELTRVDMELQPYKISSPNPLKRSLSFAGYKTHKFRGGNKDSWFSIGTLYIDNKILTIDVPLHKTRPVEIFSFAMKTDTGIVSRTECRAVLRQHENFSLFRPEDSTFFNIKNVDYLEARIQTGNDTTHIWYMAAANLNGSDSAEQQGIIRCGDKEIRFVKTTHLLREEPVNRNDIKSLLTTLNIVYLFTYNDENIAAVSYKLNGKKFWCRDDLDSNIKTVVASAASLLCLRSDLY
ncbi:MAG TPA: hypothetical protein VF008_19275 [Niastella sp.]